MCKIHRIIFEISDGWATDKNSIHRFFLGNFLTILSLKKIPISIISTGFPSYGIERLEFKNNLTFAFHSFKNNPNTWTYKESPIIGKYSIDKRGYCGWADISVNFDKYKDKINSLRIEDANKIIAIQHEKFLNTKQSKYEQKNLKEKLPSKYVFFPLQLINDSAACHANIDMLSVLDYVANLAKELKFNIVIKRHPLCPSSAIKTKLKILNAENKFVTISETNIHDLIENAYSVIACNSGVSLEALIANKAVYCFGKSEWYYASNMVNHIDEIRNAFSNDLTYMNEFQRKLIAYLISDYWVDYNDLNKIEKIIDNCIKSFEFISGHDEHQLDVESLTQKRLEMQSLLSNLKKENILLTREYNQIKTINKKLMSNPLIIIKILVKKISLFFG